MVRVNNQKYPGEYTDKLITGARIAATVLGDPALKEDWKQDLITMSSRIKSMRRALYDELKRLNTPGTWEHIINQIGMFSYTGLTKDQVRILLQKYHIYILDSGRISISGCKLKHSFPFHLIFVAPSAASLFYISFRFVSVPVPNAGSNPSRHAASFTPALPSIIHVVFPSRHKATRVLCSHPRSPVRFQIVTNQKEKKESDIG